MNFFLLYCIHGLVLLLAATFTYFFPEVLGHFLDALIPASNRVPTIITFESMRYRLAMFISGSFAIFFFASMLGRFGLHGSPLARPDRLKTLGFFYFFGIGIFFCFFWVVFFGLVFIAPGWVRYNVVYGFVMAGLFAMINGILHIFFLKIKSILNR